MRDIKKIVIVLTVMLGIGMQTKAQDVIKNPDISYAGTPRTCEIGGIAVKGVEGYEDYVLTGLWSLRRTDDNGSWNRDYRCGETLLASRAFL